MSHRTDSAIPGSFRFGHTKQDVEIDAVEIPIGDLYKKRALEILKT